MIYRKALTSELSNTAGGAFTVLFSIVVTIGLVRILNQTAGGRYDTGSILEVVAYTSLVNLPALISLALFLAVLMTLNRYWRDSEMFVWFSAGGLSLASWIRPVLKFTIPIVFLVAACSIVISPWSRSQIQSYRDRFAQKEDVTKLSSGRFIEAKSGRQVFFLEQVDQERGNVETLLLVELKKDGSRSVLTSKKGHLETKPNGDRYVILQDGRKYETDPSGLGASVSDFGEYEVRLDSSPTSQVSSARVNAMPFKELLESKNRKAPAEIFWRLSWAAHRFEFSDSRYSALIQQSAVAKVLRSDGGGFNLYSLSERTVYFPDMDHSGQGRCLLGDALYECPGGVIVGLSFLSSDDAQCRSF